MAFPTINIMIPSMHTIEKFKKTITGRVILPRNEDYDQASTVFIRKGKPALIVEVCTPQDVARAIAFARKETLAISVRSGGHSNAGFSTNDGGMIIDVGKLSEVTIVDKTARRVRVGAGALWDDVAKTLNAYDLGISSGDTRSVGVGGLTLGAGIGWMVRKYGLTIDSLRSIEVVTADGEIIEASATSKPELFWALRGGGGNFGVVTAFEFVAHPIGDIYFGWLMYSAQDAIAVLRGWRDIMRKAPEELTTMVNLMPANAMGANPEMLVVQCCWDGGNEAALNAALLPLRTLAKVLSDDVVRKRYYEVLEEAHPPKSMHFEVNNTFFDDFSDEAIEKIVTSYRQGRIFQIRSVGGAMNHVPPDATAFAHRSSEVLVVSPQFFPLATPEADIQDGLKAWRDIASMGKGAYINFFSRATAREIAASYPPTTYKRLMAIKKMYDPQNIFNQNLNIKLKIAS